MIAILSLVVLMSAYLIANALNRTSTEVGIERDQRTVQALREAKAARDRSDRLLAAITS